MLNIFKNYMLKFLLFMLPITFISASGPDTNPDVQFMASLGRVSAFAFSTNQAMDAFTLELEPIQAELAAIANKADQDEVNIPRNITERLLIIGTKTLATTGKQRYEELSAKCETIKDAIPLRIARLAELTALLQAKMPIGRVNSAVTALIHPNQPRTTERERRLVQSGRRNHVRRPDGTTFVPTDSGGFIPVRNASSSNPAEEIHAQCVNQQKRERLAQIIKCVEQFQQNAQNFLKLILRRETVVSYNLELHYGDRDLSKLMEYAKFLAQRCPDTADKNYWRGIYKKHLEEYSALLKANEAQKSPEELEQGCQRQLAIAMFAEHEAQRELNERRLEQQRIRELRALEQEEPSDDDVEQPPAAAIAKPVEPMEVLAFDNFDSSRLAETTKAKFESAIAAIKNHETPTDFRGNIKIEGINVLHCGLGSGLRLYYAIKNGKLYVLDVSNHDMDSLCTIVKKFIQEFDAR